MHRLLKLTSALMVALALTGCPGEEPPATGVATLAISPSPRTILGDGTATQLRVTATNAQGQPGTGDVVLTAAAGSFENDQKTLTLTLVDGKALTTWRCLRSADAACQGFVRVEGDWSEVSGGTSVQVTAPTSTGGGDSDGGTPDGGDGGGTPDGGGDPDAPVVGAPANIVFLSASSKPVLGIRSSNLEVSTPVSFLVTDLNQRPVPKVVVNFDVRGAGGVALSAFSAETTGEGLATTTLLSGDEVGIATVRATVAGTSLSASSLGTPIVGARPSDEGFTVSCTKINLAANASETPPRQDLASECQAQLVDRFKNPVVLTTSVNWYSEAGSIQSPVSSNGPGTGPDSGGELGNGIVLSEFRTAGKWPPANVAPLVSEPEQEGRNPRDMLATVIAVTSGEEEFYDGSGASNGAKDGQWSPGEWFVDLPEPFVDENDNQRYDLGETFIDTQRLNCATGQREPKNGRWDPPNGCWDGDLLVWRPTHILYSGFATVLGGPGSTWVLTPTSPNYVVPRESTVNVSFIVHDDFFNPLAPEGASIGWTPAPIKGTSKLALVDARLNNRYFGFSIIHERLEVASAPGTALGYTVAGRCDPSKAVPDAAKTDPSLARCVRQYRIERFVRGNSAVLSFTGVAGTDTKPAETGVGILSAGNDYSSSNFGVTYTVE